MPRYTIELSETIYNLLNKQATVQNSTLEKVIERLLINTSLTILEIFDDPDEGLELRDETQERLRRSLAATPAVGETRSAQEVAAKLGLAW